MSCQNREWSYFLLEYTYIRRCKVHVPSLLRWWNGWKQFPTIKGRWNGLKQFPTVKGRWKYSSIPLQFIFAEVIVIQWYNMKWRKRPSLLWKKNFLLSVRVHNIMSSSCHGQRCSVKHHFERCLSHPVAEE